MTNAEFKTRLKLVYNPTIINVSPLLISFLENNSFNNEDKDTLALMYSKIHAGYTINKLKYKDNEHYVNVCSSVLVEIKNQYKKYINILLENDLISKYNNSYSNYEQDKFCKLYSIYDTKTDYYTLKSKFRINKAILEFEKEIIPKIWKNPLAKNYILNIFTLDKLKMSWVSKRGEIYEDKDTKFKGRCIRSLDTEDYQESVRAGKSDKYICLETSLEMFQYYLGRDNQIILPIISKSGRVFHSYNMIPKWIRGLVRYKGEDLVSLDFSSLHPNILLKKICKSDRFYTHDQVVEWFLKSRAVTDATQEEKDILRLKVKIEGLSYFNEKPFNRYRYKILHEFIQNEYPELLKGINKYIINVKSSKMKYDEYDSHKSISYLAIKEETNIFSIIIKELDHLNGKMIHIHDELLVPKRYENEVREKIEEVVKRLGYSNLKI